MLNFCSGLSQPKCDSARSTLGTDTATLRGVPDLCLPLSGRRDYNLEEFLFYPVQLTVQKTVFYLFMIKDIKGELVQRLNDPNCLVNGFQ